MPRDRARERRWLEAAVRLLPSSFVDHACTRLELGEQTYGGRWENAGVAHLLVELSEEAADLGAWSALAVQALDAEELPPAVRERVLSALQQAARAGADAHAALEAAQRSLSPDDRG